METRVYISDISILKANDIFEHLLLKVPEYRQKKILKCKIKSKQLQSLGVGLLLKKACEDFNIKDLDKEVFYNENGKPYFKNFKQVHYNLSHSGQKVMCIMSDFEVGCDVEKIKGEKLKLAKRFFTSEECQWIMKQGENGVNEQICESNQSKAFYRLWTLKESYMKVTGCGLSLSPEKFLFQFSESGEIFLYHDFLRKNYLFHEYDFNDGYCYACSVNIKSTESDFFLKKRVKENLSKICHCDFVNML